MIPDFPTRKQEDLFYMREIIAALNLTNGSLCQDPKDETPECSNTWTADNKKEIIMAEEIYKAIQLDHIKRRKLFFRIRKGKEKNMKKIPAAKRPDMATVKKSIDWKEVDHQKAQHIYNEGRLFLTQMKESLNTLNGKASQFLALAIPILIAVTSYLITQYKSLDRPILVSGIILGLFLSVSTAFFLLGIFPRSIRYIGVEPLSFFAPGSYKKSMGEILQSSIRSLMIDIEWNRLVVKKRGKRVRLGIYFFTLSPVAAVLSFFIVLLTA